MPCTPRCDAEPRAHRVSRGQHVSPPCPRGSGASSSAALPCQPPGLCRHPVPSGTGSAGRSEQWQVWLHPTVSRGTDCRGESGVEQPAVGAAGFIPQTLESTTAPRIGPFRVEHLLPHIPLARGMFAGTREPCLSRARMSDPRLSVGRGLPEACRVPGPLCRLRECSQVANSAGSTLGEPRAGHP